MIEHFLTLTGITFWTVAVGVLVLSFLIMALVEYNRPFWATFVVLLTATTLIHITQFPFMAEVRANPLILFYWVIGYLLLGAGWSIFKWWRYVEKTVQGWLKRGYHDDMSKLKLLKQSDELPKEIDPSVNKDRFFGWILYWPFSMFWTLLDDPLRAIFDFMYEQFGQVYTRIALKVARRIAGKISS